MTPTQALDAVFAIDQHPTYTPELAQPARALHLSAAGRRLATWILTDDPSATRTPDRDNGGVPLGADDELVLWDNHRLVLVDSHTLQQHGAPLPTTMKGGQITAIQPAGRRGYAPGRTDGHVSIHGGSQVITSVQFTTDQQGRVAGFLGLPVAYDGAGPPLVILEAPPLPAGQSGLKVDLSSVCFDYQPPEPYYPLPGTVLRGLYWSAPTAKSGKRTGPAYYALIVPVIVDNDPDHPAGELRFDTADAVGQRPRIVIGKGIFSYGRQDPGERAASFGRVDCDAIRLNVHRSDPGADALGRGALIALEVQGREVLMLSNGKTWDIVG